MHPLAAFAAKFVFKKVAKEFATQVNANPNTPSFKSGKDVYIKEIDAKKAWVAGIVAALTIATATGLMPAEVSQALIEFFSNEAVQEGLEGLAE